MYCFTVRALEDILFNFSAHFYQLPLSLPPPPTKEKRKAPAKLFHFVRLVRQVWSVQRVIVFRLGFRYRVLWVVLVARTITDNTTPKGRLQTTVFLRVQKRWST